MGAGGLRPRDSRCALLCGTTHGPRGSTLSLAVWHMRLPVGGLHDHRACTRGPQCPVRLSSLVYPAEQLREGPVAERPASPSAIVGVGDRRQPLPPELAGRADASPSQSIGVQAPRDPPESGRARRRVPHPTEGGACKAPLSPQLYSLLPVHVDGYDQRSEPQGQCTWSARRRMLRKICPQICSVASRNHERDRRRPRARRQPREFSLPPASAPLYNSLKPGMPSPHAYRLRP